MPRGVSPSSQGSGFLLGGVSAALVVLTVAGASLMLSVAHAGKADGELRSLKAVPEARAQEFLG